MGIGINIGAACGFFQFTDNSFERGIFMNEKIRKILDYVMRKSKIIFPIVVVVAVAITVVFALNANGRKAERVEKLSAPNPMTEESTDEPTVELDYTEIPLVPNEDPAVYTLIATYFNAMALGDSETLTSICNTIADEDMIRFQETAKYLESYPALEVYTKPGFEQGSTIAYVYYRVIFSGRDAQFPGYQALYICTNEAGELYIKREGFSDEVNEYIMTLSAQADVVEFNNRVTVEYNDLMTAQPELLEYLSELNSEISKNTGVLLAQQVANQTPEEQPADPEQGNGTNPEETPAAPETTPEPVVIYVKAKTTVNVRSSDSEQADKLGKATEGTRLQVLEQRENGWTKVLFENKEGYIKTDYLEVIENANDVTVIGSVKATTNINVREAASETATRLGVLAGGDSAELIATENGWCKIKYNGQIGYVKADYVE